MPGWQCQPPSCTWGAVKVQGSLTACCQPRHEHASLDKQHPRQHHLVEPAMASSHIAPLPVAHHGEGTVHRICLGAGPVIKGVKWNAVKWIHGKPFRGASPDWRAILRAPWCALMEARPLY